MDPTKWLEIFQANPWIGSVVFIVVVGVPAWAVWRKARGSEAIEFARMQLEAHKALLEEMNEHKRQIKEQGDQIHLMGVEINYLTQQAQWMAQYIDDLRWHWTNANQSEPPKPRTRPPPEPVHIAERRQKNVH